MTRFSIVGGRTKVRPLFFGLAAAALLFGRAAARAESGPGPGATVTERRFDFGRIRRGEKIMHEFHVHNSGSAPLAFTSAELSMPGMTCRISPPLAPGADGTITVEWKTDRVQGAVDGLAEISTNDPENPSIALALTGRIDGPLSIEPLPAVFLSVFRANTAGPVSLRLVAGEGSHYRAAIDSVEPGRAWRLRVRPAAGVLPGRYDETLTLESGDPSIGRVAVPVHLFVKGDVYANPDDLDFGDVGVPAKPRPGDDALVPQTFFVKKRSGVFRILRVRSDLPLRFRVDPDGRPGGSFQIEAGVRPDARRGSLDGTITIETDNPQFPRLTLGVRGRIVE